MTSARMAKIRVQLCSLLRMIMKSRIWAPGGSAKGSYLIKSGQFLPRSLLNMANSADCQSSTPIRSPSQRSAIHLSMRVFSFCLFTNSRQAGLFRFFSDTGRVVFPFLVYAVMPKYMQPMQPFLSFMDTALHIGRVS